MTSIVTSILNSTLGLLWNKARDAAAENFQDGDVTDAKIRKIVVIELNDIKTKLDGLSRKDLLSSYSYLKEGVQLLNDSLDRSKDKQKAVMNEDDGSVTSSTMPSGGDILDDALQLSQVMGRLKIESNQSGMAEERFKEARKQATLAFCNEALSIQDRIFATKLRVVAQILECLERPDTAVTSCVFFLEELYDLPAVREIFSVYLGSGLMAKFGKTEGVEHVKSIMIINYVLYQFVQKFSSNYYPVFNWPIIQLIERTFNPILGWREVSVRRSWGDELKRPPNGVEIDEQINPYKSAVNSRRERIVVDNVGVRIISKTGKTKSVLPLPVLRSQDDDGNEIKHYIAGVAVDEENNVYLAARYYKDRYVKSENDQEVLYVLDEHCNHVKHKSLLNFQPRIRYVDVVLLAVNKNKEIVMIGEDNVYVCDVTGQLKYQFKPKCDPSSIGVSENNEIIIESRKANTVKIYTEEGNLKTTIKLPAGHEVLGVAFHFGISKIIVLSYYKEKKSLYLHCYSETGEQHMSICLGKTAYFGYPAIITSHPSGPAAVVTRNAILYL